MKYRPAAEAAIAELKRQGEDPAEFLVAFSKGDEVEGTFLPIEVMRSGRPISESDWRPYFSAGERPNANILVLQFLHSSFFLPANEGVKGNPGGKGRSMHFDRTKGNIVSTGLWQ